MSVLKDLINANNSLSQGRTRAKIRAGNQYPLVNSKKALQDFMGLGFKYSSIVPPVIVSAVDAEDAKSDFGVSINEGDALILVHTTVSGVESIAGLKVLIADLESVLVKSASKDDVEYVESFDDTPKGSFFTLGSIFIASNYFDTKA